MLVLDASGFHRQQDEIAFLPILALAVDDGIALAFEDVDDEAALMPVLARSRLDVVQEDTPMLQRGVLERHRIEIEQKLALTRLEPLAILHADDDRSGQVARGELLSLAHDALVRIVADRRPLALPHPFEFSHRSSTPCRRGC